jgi:hypothetical protein
MDRESGEIIFEAKKSIPICEKGVQYRKDGDND